MISKRQAALRTMSVAIAATVFSCGGTYDDQPTGSTGSFEVRVSPTSIGVGRGQTTFVTALLLRSGGFSGAVVITIANLPNGVSATMDPAVLSGHTTLSRVNLAAASAATGSFTVTIAGTSGQKTASATFALSVS